MLFFGPILHILILHNQVAVCGSYCYKCLS